MNAEEIAAKVEHDMKLLGRKWKEDASKRKRKISLHVASIRASALYLHTHTDLYLCSDDIQEIKNNHQNWMTLLCQWFEEA